jgi:hypothetical protein
MEVVGFLAALVVLGFGIGMFVTVGLYEHAANVEEKRRVQRRLAEIASGAEYDDLERRLAEIAKGADAHYSGDGEPL